MIGRLDDHCIYVHLLIIMCLCFNVISFQGFRHRAGSK
jgi:hypothetical protein